MKILILLFYYNRPNIVRNALNSIRESNYDNWHLAFIDDGSETPGEPIVKEILHEHLDKITFYNTFDSKETKEKRGGSVFGKLANEAMLKTDSDICIMLCDDDALHPEYLSNLNSYYNKNTEIKYAYSHVIVFDCLKEDYKKKQITEFHLNHTHSLNPCNSVDASQVSWRIECSKDGKCLFPFPQTVALDYVFYSSLYSTYGDCPFTGFVGQYKSWSEDQLGRRPNPYNYSN